MVPLVVLNPYLGGGLLVEYFGHRRFDPARNALISNLDSGCELDAPMTRDDRLRYQSRMDELSQSRSAIDGLKEGENKEVKTWERMQASAQPGLDVLRQPILQMRVGEDLSHVGLSRANILSASDSQELAARLIEARLRQELRPALARKTSRRDVEKDLALFQQLLSLQSREVAVTPASINASRTHAVAGLQ
jgi:hypothetical protein